MRIYFLESILFACLCTIVANAEDWPHWRGPNRDDTTSESSGFVDGKWLLADAWEGNVGEGSTSPLVVGEQVFVLGWKDGRDHLRCLDLKTGREIWTQSYAAKRYARKAMGDQGLYACVISTPEFDPTTGGLYTLGLDGELNCWSTRSGGRLVWSVNLYDRYDMPVRTKIGRSAQRDYGYTTAPLIYNDWLLVEAGGEAGTVVALNKMNGAEVWTSEYNGIAGHSGGPVLLKVDGVDCLAAFTLMDVVVMRLDNRREGETVGTTPWVTSFANNVANPAAVGNSLLVTSDYNIAATARLSYSLADGVKEVWRVRPHSKICSPLVYKDKVYFVWQQPYCLDLATGDTVWTGPRRYGDAGSGILTGDKRLIFFTGDGDLSLVATAEESPKEFTVLAEKKGLFHTDAWPHTVLANGHLLCKDRNGAIKVFRVGK
jgi:outer membrane protein assembly factor BamB